MEILPFLKKTFNMKKIIFILLTILCSCMNTKQDKSKSNNAPEDFFAGKQLEMGEAIFAGDLQKVEQLVKSEKFHLTDRGNVKSDGRLQQWTYLGYATLIGELKIAEKLLQLGADVNDVSFDDTAIISNIGQACSLNNKGLITLFLNYNVDLNPPLDESPISKLMINEGDRSTIQMLIVKGADLNHQNYYSGSVPIMTALRINKFDLVHYFLDKGADPIVLDYVGNSFAFLVQKEIDEGRLNAEGLKEFEKIINRLTNEFKVSFPLKNEYKKGLQKEILRYENLSQKDKSLLGEKEATRIELIKNNLEKDLSPSGQKFK